MDHAGAVSEFTVDIEQIEDGEFRVRFGDPGREPVSGPRATELLAVAIGQCLSASLLFLGHRPRDTPTTGLRDVGRNAALH